MFALGSVYRKCHYRVPIVAFLTNVTKKKNATIVFAFQSKVEFAKLDFRLESKHYGGGFLVPIATFIENATIGYL